MVKPRHNLTGRTCGNFLVLEQVEDYISLKGVHRAQWKCKCLLCGNDSIIIMDSVLQKGSKVSCGCLEDLSGKDFGNLHVIEKVGINKAGASLWKCQCSCNSFVTVEHARLTSGNTKSCGCLRKQLTSERFQKSNVFDLTGEFGIGWTTNTNKEFYFDLADYDLIAQYAWSEDIAKNGYSSLRTRVKGSSRTVKMTTILGFKRYDHINRNALDNRRCNLRPASAQENARNRSRQRNNTSGFIGVAFEKHTSNWIAYIKISQKTKKLGRFKEKDDAIKARLEAEAKYYGEFAPQRHLFKEYNIIQKEGK